MLSRLKALANRLFLGEDFILLPKSKNAAMKELLARSAREGKE